MKVIPLENNPLLNLNLITGYHQGQDGQRFSWIPRLYALQRYTPTELLVATLEEPMVTSFNTGDIPFHRRYSVSLTYNDSRVAFGIDANGLWAIQVTHNNIRSWSTYITHGAPCTIELETTMLLNGMPRGETPYYFRNSIMRGLKDMVWLDATELGPMPYGLNTQPPFAVANVDHTGHRDRINDIANHFGINFVIAKHFDHFYQKTAWITGYRTFLREQPNEITLNMLPQIAIFSSSRVKGILHFDPVTYILEVLVQDEIGTRSEGVMIGRNNCLRPISKIGLMGHLDNIGGYLTQHIRPKSEAEETKLWWKNFQYLAE